MAFRRFQAQQRFYFVIFLSAVICAHLTVNRSVWSHERGMVCSIAPGQGQLILCLHRWPLPTCGAALGDCLHTTCTHRHNNYLYTYSVCRLPQGWRGSSCTKCLCSNTKYSYMLTTVTLTPVFIFMATEEAVAVSNLCRVMQAVSLCYLVMSAQTPHTYACPYTHTCTHTDRHAHTQTDMHTHRQTCTHLEQVSQSFYFWLYLAHE